MFSKRITLSNRKFNMDFFRSFVSDLKEAGFNDIKIMLPHNLITDSKKDLIEVEEFTKRERNYVSVIFIAKNTANKEIIKILFINENAKAFFKDDTFPSGHSEPFEAFVQGPDPARVFALSGFLKERLAGVSFLNYIFWLFYFTAILVFIIELLTYSSRGKFIFDLYHKSYLLDIVVFLYSFVFMFRFFSREKGLYVKERGNVWYQWIMSLIKGEYKNNPVVTLIVTVIAGIIVYAISKILDYFLKW